MNVIRPVIGQGGKDMKIYFTVTGTGYRFGQEFAEPGLVVSLAKEPDNEYDSEAIKVSVEGLGQIGYVANSPRTVIGESFSAGRLYDKIGDTAEGIVKFNIKPGTSAGAYGLVCELVCDRADTVKVKSRRLRRYI